MHLLLFLNDQKWKLLVFGMVRVIESILLMSSSQKIRLSYAFSPQVIREKPNERNDALFFFFLFLFYGKLV